LKWAEHICLPELRALVQDSFQSGKFSVKISLKMKDKIIKASLSDRLDWLNE
jgi:hypothetical protein